METAMTQPHPYVQQLRLNTQQRRFLMLASATEHVTQAEIVRSLIDGAIASTSKRFRTQLELPEDDFTELLVP
jgi:hypothetical protein